MFPGGAFVATMRDIRQGAREVGTRWARHGEVIGGSWGILKTKRGDFEPIDLF